MKRILLLSIMTGTVLVLTQCSPKTKTATETTRTTKTETSGGATQSADIAQGKEIFTASCGRCHKLFQPESRTVDQWNKILPPMYRKAKLTDDQAKLVAAYVLPNAKKG